jgi:hypothetical protein
MRAGHPQFTETSLNTKQHPVKTLKTSDASPSSAINMHPYTKDLGMLFVVI